MTDAELDELERLADAATPGPWFAIEYPGGAQIDCGAHEICDFADNENFEENVTFAAAANPTTVKALIAEVRRLRREFRTIAELCGVMHHQSMGESYPGTATEIANACRAIERERCARIAQGNECVRYPECDHDGCEVAATIAKEIRGGGNAE